MPEQRDRWNAAALRKIALNTAAISAVLFGTFSPVRPLEGQVQNSNASASTHPAKRHFWQRPFQIGKASWYGKELEGSPTASGEPFDPSQLTAAHPTLPLGTWVKVTNTRNQRWVLVRINDRGPGIPDRIIDLSYTAARMLRMTGRGLATVRLDLVKTPEESSSLALLTTPK